jgi:hypothetical protein
VSAFRTFGFSLFGLRSRKTRALMMLDKLAQKPIAIETWHIDQPRPYERNARTHSPEQIEQLRNSFRTYGQVWPILVREDGTVISGHGRIEAAKAEGFETLQVIVARLDARAMPLVRVARQPGAAQRGLGRRDVADRDRRSHRAWH